MKRDLSVITDEVREDIQLWLDEMNYDHCPFITLDEEDCPDPSICKAIFPTLEVVQNLPSICPCDAYGKSYVIKVAKEIIQT